MKEATDSTLCDFSHLACRLASLLCAGLLLVSGCSDSLESTISGTLTNDGQPVPLAQIVFHPIAGGPLPYAVTSDDGSYNVITAAQTGLEAGEYIAVVEAMKPDVSLPKMYGSVATSPLKYQIKPGKNVIDISLK
jgi:hypothetical protein